MKQGKSRGIWIIALLLAVVYPFLFPRPLGRALYLKPAWSLDLGRPPAAQAGSPQAAGERGAQPPPQPQTASWFRVGDRFGYVDLDGGLRYLDRVLWGVCLSDAGFINFGRMSEGVVFSDPQGRFLYGFQGPGYPLLDRSGQNLFLVNTDLSGIRRVSPEGDGLWSLEFSSPITTAALSAEGALIGLQDGRLLLVNPQGKTDLELAAAGSRIPILLGSAASPAGGRMAAVSGIDPQRLTVLEKKEGRYTPVLTRRLDSDLRREVMLQFTENGRFLLCEGQEALEVLDLAQKRQTRIPLPGRLVAMTGGSPEAPAWTQETVAVLTRLPGSGGRRDSLLTVIGLPGRVLAAERIAAPADFLRQLGTRCLLGLEGRLLRLDIREE